MLTKQPVKIPVAGLASVTIAAAALLFTHNSAYLETRPSQTQTLALDHPSVLQVDARLWQDPFAAVDIYERATSTRYGFNAKMMSEVRGTPSEQRPAEANIAPPADESARDARQLGFVKDEISKLAQPVMSVSGATSKRPLVILAVTMAGNAFVGGEEWRRRERYAVVSGLGAEAFAPRDDEHIGYFTYYPNGEPSAVERPPRSSVSVRVPFEIFETTSRGAEVSPHHVLLLWVDDMALSRVVPTSNWLEELRKLTGSLAPCSMAPGDARCSLRVIGPSSSDQYAALAPKDGTNMPRKDGSNAVAQAASAADDSLLVISPYVTSNVVSDTTVPAYASIISTIPQDGVVLARIVRELFDREVPVCDEQSAVALLSEWDTEYGRRASDSLNGAIESTCKEVGQPRKTHAQVEIYSFVRGLDGALLAPVGSGATGFSAGQTPNSRADAASRTRIEWPETADQRDYVRRLGERIAERQRQGHQRIKAIGIMASDAHDKLLLLQALREKFTDVPFFTTDADARLFHPEVQDWTRNLIVGSAFGLTLAEQLQGSTPPFRDVYQTSVYLATLYALQPNDPSRKGLVLAAIAKKWTQSSEIFEVGRSRLVRLCRSRDDTRGGPRSLGPADDASEGVCQREHKMAEQGSSGCGVKSLNSCASVIDTTDPDQLSTKERHLVTCVIAAVVLSIAGFGTLSYRRLVRLRKANKDRALASRGIVFLARTLLGVLFAVLAFGVWLAQIATGSLSPFSLSEPGVLTQGVSSAPVALCWWMALSMTFLYLGLIVTTTPGFFAEVERRFIGSELRSLTVSSSDRRRFFLWWMWSELFSSAALHQKGTIPGAFEETWALYKHHSFSRTRLLRILAWWILMCLLPMLLITPWFPEPKFPIRGAMHSVLHILAPAGFMSLMVLMAVLADTVFCCCIFVVAVGHRRNTYPAEIVETTVRRYELLENLKENTDSLLDTELISTRTAIVARYLYYPFVVMSILALGLFASLEHWARWPGRFVIIGLSVLEIGGLWALLRWSAERARATALEELETAQIQALSRYVRMTRMRQAVVGQCRLLSRHISMVREGAYAALQDQPMVRAILLPIGGAGAAQLLQYLSSRLG